MTDTIALNSKQLGFNGPGRVLCADGDRSAAIPDPISSPTPEDLTERARGAAAACLELVSP